ncbi:MAG TPA: DUF1588 domain-containing protein, partial [Polyangiaceae bacterium]|nr:DUF1588 domain-containing protein [Polyangiaceae bacterium]
MRTSAMVAGFAAVVALAACSPSKPPGGGSHDAGSGGNGNASTGGSSGKGSGGSTSGDGGSGGTQPPTTACTQANTGSATLRLLTRGEFENSINDIFPNAKGKWTNSLPADSVSAYGFDNAVTSSVGNQKAGALLDTALSIGTAVTGSELQNLLPCAASAKDHACAETFVTKYGLRLFRREPTADETKRYLDLFDTALALTDFPTALKWVTAGLIQSPYSVYRSELGTVAGGVRKLSAYEIATELAYTFGGSTPSEDLLQKAAAAGDGDFPDVAGTAKSLVNSPGGQLALQHFFAGYFDYTRVASVDKMGLTGAPSAFTSVSGAMVDETQAFLTKVILDGTGTFNDLFTSKTTYPSQQLAAFYGSDPTNSAKFPVPGSDGSVTRPDGQGVGILAQGSFLASHSNSDASSPTQRGLFVYYRLLCQGKVKPPEKVPPISSAEQTKTTRERYEKAHATPGSTCATCHMFFDPIGFGFESFDAAGRFRTQQNGEPIDASG